MISIIKGAVFINGEKEKNAEKIGFAILDFTDSLLDNDFVITLKDEDVFIEKTHC